MVETFQDDARETATRRLFRLDDVPGRATADAVLTLSPDHTIEFELKSTSDSRRSVTTVRDFGPDHVARWKTKHWLFAFYERGAPAPSYYLYGSPRMMEKWISEKWEYVSPDFNSAEIAADRLTVEDLYSVLGEKDEYSIDDARRLHKRQYSIQQYREDMDRPNGYSKSKMLNIFKKRVLYLVRRGSTLNNPHIPGSYFNNWNTKIESHHAAQLRELVRKAVDGLI